MNEEKDAPSTPNKPGLKVTPTPQRLTWVSMGIPVFPTASQRKVFASDRAPHTSCCRSRLLLAYIRRSSWVDQQNLHFGASEWDNREIPYHCPVVTWRQGRVTAMYCKPCIIPRENPTISSPAVMKLHYLTYISDPLRSGYGFTLLAWLPSNVLNFLGTLVH